MIGEHFTTEPHTLPYIFFTRQTLICACEVVHKHHGLGEALMLAAAPLSWHLGSDSRGMGDPCAAGLQWSGEELTPWGRGVTALTLHWALAQAVL